MKARWTITIFAVLVLFPFAIHFIFNNLALYRRLFDWPGVVDYLTDIPLFLAAGNFLIICRYSRHKVIPFLAAAAMCWLLLIEIDWGMQFTDIRNHYLTNFTGIAGYIHCINTDPLRAGGFVLLLTPVLHLIPAARRWLGLRGYPFPDLVLYVGFFLPNIIFEYFAPHRELVQHEIQEFHIAVWFFLLSAYRGATNEDRV